ncbi:MAG: molybdopterin molybdotransferase MoeA [Acidobacteriota bacterium]|nr:molybdopterin molybdotransferase MoeA [Acidobacteriota bacterium]
MISADEARNFVLYRLAPLAPVDLDLASALGCVAAARVSAREPSPSFTNSAMDGFALRASDTAAGGARLRVIDSVFAGESSDVTVGTGEAARIMTGAPLPLGADAVCPREDTAVVDGEVVIQRAVAVGDSVRHVGEDVRVGQVLVEPGDLVGPALLGALAAQGITSLAVRPTPRVGVMSTGNELADGESLAPGHIRDSNRPTLLASLRQSGFVAVDLGVVRDATADLADAFRQAVTRCDAVISTGGVSAGDADFVKVALAELFGDAARSMQVAIRPGKPFTYAYDEATKTPFFALAGNPVSTLVGFELFVRPALRRLGGHRVIDRPEWPMVLDCDLPRGRDAKVHYVHGVCRLADDGLHVERVVRAGSHLLFGIAGANCLIVSPESDGMRAGDVVRAMILDHSSLVGLLPV